MIALFVHTTSSLHGAFSLFPCWYDTSLWWTYYHSRIYHIGRNFFSCLRSRRSSSVFFRSLLPDICWRRRSWFFEFYCFRLLPFVVSPTRFTRFVGSFCRIRVLSSAQRRIKKSYFGWQRIFAEKLKSFTTERRTWYSKPTTQKTI